MKRRIWKRAISLVAVGMLVGGVALTQGDVRVSAAESPVEAAIQAYKAENGVSLSEAENAIEDQDILNDSIQGELNDGKINIWIEPGALRQEIHVRSTDSEKLLEIKNLNFSDETEVVVHQENSFDVEKGLDLAELPDDLRSVIQGEYVDPETGVLVLEVSRKIEDSEVGLIQGAVGSLSLRFVVTGAAQDSAINVYGGASMNGCTVGFTAVRNGNRGFFSARHCSNMRSKRVWSRVTPSGPSTTWWLNAYSPVEKADIAFYGVPAGNKVQKSYYGKSSRSTVRNGSPGSVAPGTTACHRGETTGWRCGKIASISYRPTWKEACPGKTCSSTFVKVNAYQQPGDSGGPWVAGGRILGIHKGGNSGHSVYSKISNLPPSSRIYY